MKRLAAPLAIVVVACMVVLGGPALAPSRSVGGSVAGDKGLIAFESVRDGNVEIYVMNADGTGQTRLTNNAAYDGDPAWSPDGSRIAFDSDRDGNTEVYVMNADGTDQTGLTNNPAWDWRPAWSPDGSKIAFVSERDGNWEVYMMNADGTGQTRLTNNAAYDGVPAWSPDGSRIAFDSDRDGNQEVYVMNADGSDGTRLTNNPAQDQWPAWSPDGSKIAFSSLRDDNDDIYVMNADGTGQTRLTNNPHWDEKPAWSPDGSKIAFVSGRDGHGEIYVMNADGSAQTNLTRNAADDWAPAWQPGPPSCPTTCAEADNGLNTCDLESGDILLSQQVGGLYAAENVLFNGYWTHAGIYNGCGMITESSGTIDCETWWKVWTCLSDEPGVETKPIEDSGFWSAPDWAILRTNSNGGKRDAAVAYAKAQNGKKYNWIYLDKWTEDKFYCSQLVWRAYETQGMDLDSNRGALNGLIKWVGPWGVADAAGVTAAVPPDDIYFDDDVTIVKQRPGIGAALRRAVLRILSPAHLYLTDPEGRHTGVDPSTGQVVEEIPGVFYSGPDVEPEFLSIQDMAGTWETQVIGAGQGPYTLQLENLDAENHRLTEVGGEAKEGQVTTYEATHLAAGWNNRCYAGEQKTVEEALAEIIDSVVAVYRLNPGQTFARWFPGRPDVSTITTVAPYQPLFVLMANDASWIQTPSGAPPTSAKLAQGWNSVCYTGQTKPAGDATAGMAGNFNILYRLGSDQAWDRFVPGRPEVSSISDLNTYDSVLMLITAAGGAQWVFDP